ncbi:MAG: chemotaxis protein CheB [Pseudomonadota bacterium]|nr:chemotaxis protein CheB [Pseudomonadota bacterium]
MTQADDKKSARDTKIPGDSPVAESGLPDPRPVSRPSGDEPAPFPIVGVGASAGGVEALQRLFKSLPPTRDIAYIVVMHLAPAHPSHLADILAKSTSMPVVQVLSDIAVEPNRVYVIPPNHYLILDRAVLRLQQMPQPRPLPKAIDCLFMSLAEEQQERAICIILTGADHDGTVGLKAIKAAGGMVWSDPLELDTANKEFDTLVRLSCKGAILCQQGVRTAAIVRNSSCSCVPISAGER